jgi:hypothetical protein
MTPTTPLRQARAAGLRTTSISPWPIYSYLHAQYPARRTNQASLSSAADELLIVGSTKAALMRNKPAIDHYLVFMPPLKFQFIGGGGGDRVASWPT